MGSPSNEDLDQQNVEDSSTSQDTENTEVSSIPEASEEESSTFDLVKKALGDEEAEDEPEGSSGEDEESEETEDKSEDSDKKEEEDKSEDDEDDSDEPSEEELKGWKAKTRKRFEALQSKHRKTVEERDALQAKLDQAEVDAGHYKQFEGFLNQNRISYDEANTLFTIGALMKNDPAKALEMMRPYYDQLMQMTGNVLPADLQEQVSQGMITEQAALELSQRRASETTQQQISQDRQQHQTEQTAQQNQALATQVMTTISQWEQQWSASDPDYMSKKDRVLDRVELMLTRAVKEGKLPATVEDAVKLADEAKAYVEKDMQKLQPRKQPVDTVDGNTSPVNMPEPKTTEDVIRRTLSQ